MKIRLLIVFCVFTSLILFADTKTMMHVHLSNGSVVNYNTEDVDKITFESIGIDTSRFPVATEVDLGLSVNWSSWDMGASEIFDFGGRYGWGDPTGDRYSDDFDEYPSPFPPENISGTEYDIATQQWGDGLSRPEKS